MTKPKAIVVLPAYNAEATLERNVASIPSGVADAIILVDDASTDRTVEIAQRLPLTVIRHEKNRGYGANQKTCYDAALEQGADFVIMLHPDDQYDARVIPIALEVLKLGLCDIVLGNRIRTRREALQGGMPMGKYLANRSLSLVQNMLAGQNLGEWHSGFRVYTRSALEMIPYHRNSDGFAFDSELLVQSVHLGLRLADVPVPVRYFDDASSIGILDAGKYAVRTLWTFVRWYGHRAGLRPSPLFRLNEKDRGGNSHK